MKNILSLLCLSSFFILTNISAQSSALLDINDISAEVNIFGRLFQREFLVPKNSKLSTINEVNLWIGAYDYANNIHLAAQTLSPEQDFKPGPVSNHSCSSCLDNYKRVWKINKEDIKYHRAHYLNSGYKSSAPISNWPANGNVKNGESLKLAPFYDSNNNELYEPLLGEYPLILGDQAIYFILNDYDNSHVKTHAEKLGIEIHGMVYAFNRPTDSALNQTVFLNLKIINRSNFMYPSFIVGLHADLMVGQRGDELIGFHEGLNLGYIYNSDDLDLYYGNAPPAQGIMFLNQASNSFTYYFKDLYGNLPKAMVEPITANEFYRFLSGRWRDGTAFTWGGNGYTPGSSDTSKFAFTGIPGTGGWTQPSADAHHIKYIIQSGKPVVFLPGQSICYDIAFPFARDYNGTHISSTELLFERAQQILKFYNDSIEKCTFLTTKVSDQNSLVNKMYIFPNPTNGKLTLVGSHTAKRKIIYIYNSCGNIVFEHCINDENQVSINLEELEIGIYFLKYYNDDGYNVHKILKL